MEIKSMQRTLAEKQIRTRFYRFTVTQVLDRVPPTSAQCIFNSIATRDNKRNKRSAGNAVIYANAIKLLFEGIRYSVHG